MTVEEGLVGLLAAVALLLLFVGLAQALDARPSRPSAGRRGGLRRESPPASMFSRSAHPALELAPAGRPAAPTLSAIVEPSRAPSVASGVQTLAGSSAISHRSSVRTIELSAPVSHPADAPTRIAALTSDSPDAMREKSAPGLRASADGIPDVQDPAASPEITASVRESSLRSFPPAATRDPGAEGLEMALVGDCAELYLADRHAEVLRLAEPALDAWAESHVSSSTSALASLLTLVALARRALGDRPGASRALTRALEVLPERVDEGYPKRLAAMSPAIAQALLEANPAPEERVGARRLARFWLECGLAGGDGADGSGALLDRAADALADALADVVAERVTRGMPAEALAIVQRAREVGELPAARADALVGDVAASVRREIDRLTAAAIRATKDDRRAALALETAEALLGSLAGSSLPPGLWASMVRRVWRGYARLGASRLDAGRLDEAADALFHALGMKEIGRGRRRQVQVAVIRTLEAMADAKVGVVTQLIDGGDRAAATEEIERLLARIALARDARISEADLTVASTKARLLERQLASAP